LIKRLAIATTLFLLVVIPAASAKPSMRQVAATARFAASVASGSGVNAALATFESVLTPYFQARAARIAVPLSTYIPQQADLFTLAKHWSQLSSSFRALYANAVQIPPGLKTYVSPGGHFQIVYSDTGVDAVDQTDTIGYTSGNWRVQTHGGNGVPDYVELVAYAADSAWSMEIDRFGFVKPFPYIGNGYTSAQFRIYIRSFTGDEASDYGETFPDNQESGSIGFQSHIEIRNEWNEDFWPMDYTTHPEKPIRVTCVHEFFHTIQYAMTRQVVDGYVPEDFPVSWIEGTAVLMEDEGFNYVHDYLQYVSDYFDYPTTQVLEPSNDGLPVYKNSIVAMYLFQFAADTPCICFVKNMFFNDYQSPIGFVDNLRRSAGLSGRTWADLLGSFHTGSYYTGSRAVTGRFIRDADSLPEWPYVSDGAGTAQPITKTVQPFALNTFSVLRHSGDANTLSIGFLGDSLNPGEQDTNAVWSVHCIIKRDGVPADDSVISLPVFSVCKAQAEITGWDKFVEALVIVTNARYDAAKTATVTFSTCSTAVRSGQTAVYSAFPQAQSSAQNATVTVHANADLSCSMSITKTTVTPQLLDSAAHIQLTAAGVFFSLSTPQTWLHDATMELAISEPFDSVRFSLDSGELTDSLLSVYLWDATLLGWQRCPSVNSLSADSTFLLRSPVASAGTYGLFARLKDTTSAIVAFPNPARLNSTARITFAGTRARDSVVEIWIYAIDGSLVAHGANGGGPAGLDASLSATKYGFSWKLQSKRGKTVSPGVYYAYLAHRDIQTKAVKKKSQKVFVIP
jgi:hypothetical protein